MVLPSVLGHVLNYILLAILLFYFGVLQGFYYDDHKL